MHGILRTKGGAGRIFGKWVGGRVPTPGKTGSRKWALWEAGKVTLPPQSSQAGVGLPARPIQPHAATTLLPRGREVPARESWAAEPPRERWWPSRTWRGILSEGSYKDDASGMHDPNLCLWGPIHPPWSSFCVCLRVQIYPHRGPPVLLV